MFKRRIRRENRSENWSGLDTAAAEWVSIADRIWDPRCNSSVIMWVAVNLSRTAIKFSGSPFGKRLYKHESFLHVYVNGRNMLRDGLDTTK